MRIAERESEVSGQILLFLTSCFPDSIRFIRCLPAVVGHPRFPSASGESVERHGDLPKIPQELAIGRDERDVVFLGKSDKFAVIC